MTVVGLVRAGEGAGELRGRAHQNHEEPRGLRVERPCVADLGVGEDEERFDALMQLFFSDELRVIQRSSQPISKIAEKQPRLIRPYLIKLVALLKTNPIDTVKRNTMRVFQFIEIPESVEGDLFDIGLT